MTSGSSSSSALVPVQAYRCVAVQVATFPGYFLPLASHLLHVKLRHWEKALRELASLALAGDARVCVCMRNRMRAGGGGRQSSISCSGKSIGVSFSL